MLSPSISQSIKIYAFHIDTTNASKCKMKMNEEEVEKNDRLMRYRRIYCEFDYS